MATATASKDEQQRMQQQARAWDAYFGRMKKPFKATRRGSDDNILVNRCRPIVNKGASFLFGKLVRFEMPAGAPRAKSAQRYLDATWKANRQTTILQKLAVTGGVTGQAMIKIIPTFPYPTLKVIDTANVTITTLPDDVDTVIAYAINYMGQDPLGQPAPCRQLIALLPDNVTWGIMDQWQDGNEVWQMHHALVEWPYPFAPVVMAQNMVAPNQVWGLSDLEADLIAINDDINFILSNAARILRFHANPKTVGKGFDASKLNITSDGTIMLPTETASLQMLEMNSDLSSSLNFVTRLQSAMDELSHVPSISLGTYNDMPRGTVSGIALQILYQPLTEKTDGKRGTYGEMLVELCSRLLVIGGYLPADVVIHWPNVVPTNDLDEAQVALLWQQLGVSQTTIWAKLDLDPEAEAENVAEAKQDGLAPPPPAPQDPAQQPEQVAPAPLAS